MGWFGDFLSDPIGETVKGVTTLGNAIGDAGQWVGDTVGNATQSIHDNLDDYWKAGIDLTKNAMTVGTDIAVSGIQDPTDINAWTDPAQEHLDDFNETGDELFGTGGWIKAGANMFTSGNPFQGAGSVGYQLDSALSGSDYTNGKTSGIATLSNLYTLGSNAVDAYNSSGSLPTDSNSYLEATPDGGSINVTPSDFYSGTGTVSSATNLAGNPNMDITNTDYFQPNADASVNYGSLNPNFANGLIQNTDPSYLEQARRFMGGMGGKALAVGAGAIDPRLGAIVGGLGQAANGNYGQGLFDTLGGMYMANKSDRAQNRIQDNINQQIASLRSLYSADSPYAQQLSRELQRRDAASGRRSDYGGRAVELQAKLAQGANGVASTIGDLNNKGLQFSEAIKAANRSKQFAELSKLFTPAKPSTPQTGTNTGPSWDMVSKIWSGF